ncbi:MAG: hypothetical protein GY850_40470 [bacterium]|nr:hypothetical protein [bacterium]
MSKEDSVDAFTHHVLSQIDSAVYHSLTLRQLSEITQAIRSGRTQKKHVADFRGAIPLFFVRYYFVFLMGRDRREAVVGAETGRRKRGDMMAGLGFLTIIEFTIKEQYS